MDMDNFYEELWLFCITVVSSIGAWFLKLMYVKIEQVETDVSRLPEKYVLKEDYRDDMKTVHQKLDKIIDKLDEKADK